MMIGIPLEAFRIARALEGMSEQLNSGKTGIHVLEDGAGALMARAWLAPMRRRASIFSTLFSHRICSG